MRWRNEAEKKIVLEAAAEYGKRSDECINAILTGGTDEHVPTTARFTAEHFEQWLAWYLGEELHLQNVAAYMQAIPKMTAYQQPSPAEKQQTTPKQVPHRLSWPVLLDRVKAKQLSDAEYRAVRDCAAANGWKLREHEPLHSMLQKMNKGALQDKILDALQEA